MPGFFHFMVLYYNLEADMRGIELLGSNILRQQTLCIKEIDSDKAALFKKMEEIMKKVGGLGLAANQINEIWHMAVVDMEKCGESITLPNGTLYMANVELLEASKDTVILAEGCLSMPGVFEKVKRPSHIRIKYLDITNSVVEIAADGLLARVILHEIDHLNGMLFIDRLPLIKRDMVKNKIKKIVKSGYWDFVK
jgi:peptide deformylase